MTSIPVRCPSGQYEVIVEPGSLGGLGARVAAVCDARRVLLVIDRSVVDTHGAVAHDALATAGMDVHACTIEADEHQKTIETVASIYQSALAAGLDRHDVIVAVGGGLTGDVAGFAAASYLRGIDFVAVPTTLLAMVDASVGGKTGVNLPLPGQADAGPRLGKNLAGAFWQPRLVLADPEVLATLDHRHRCCGLAECVKHGLIAGEDLLELIDSNLDAIKAAEPSSIAALVDRAVRVKVVVVQEDEREQGRRAVLNLGHTFAHAIEPIEAMDLLHGEAVSIGLVGAIELSRHLGRLEGDWAEGFIQRLERIGLPTRLPAPVAIAELMLRMGYDKKVHGGCHTLVVPHCPGRVEIVSDVPEDAIVAAWTALGAN